MSIITGDVVTKRRECAKEVKSRDQTHAAKCTPRVNPLIIKMIHVFRSHILLRSLDFHPLNSQAAIGKRNSVVRLNRQHAREIGGVSWSSFCKRTPAKEMPIVAHTITTQIHHGGAAALGG